MYYGIVYSNTREFQSKRMHIVCEFAYEYPELPNLQSLTRVSLERVID